MKLIKYTARMLLMNLLVCAATDSYAKGSKQTKRQETVIDNTIASRSSSFSLPNWSDTIVGVACAGATYAIQMKYMSDFFAYLKDYSPESSFSYRLFCNSAQFIPALVTGLWSFFELRQVTSSGLYDRAVAIVDTMTNFKSTDMSFESVEHLMHYLATHGSARELRVINDQYQYVTTQVFLSALLQEVTYALRLLERSTYWISDAVMLAKIDTIMFEIRTRMKRLKHNKLLLENHPQYSLEYARYQQERQLSNQERLTIVAEDQNTLSKTKFVLNTIGRIISFVFGGSSSSRMNNNR